MSGQRTFLERRAAPWISSLFALVGCGTMEHASDVSTAEEEEPGAMMASSGSGAPPRGGHGGSGVAGVAGAPAHTSGSGAVVGGSSAAGAAGSATGGAPSDPTEAGEGGTGDGPVDPPELQSYPMLEADQIGEPVRVVNGFDLAESPLWDPCSQRLLFTDVTASVIHALEADDSLTDFATGTSNTNGIAFDVDGSLILAQMGGSPGHVARRARDGTVTQIDPAGSALHTPDDVTVRSDGTIYFSDGDFAPIGTLFGAFAQLPVYAIAPGSSALTEVARVGGPNGIELSPDERTLYLSAYGDNQIVPFTIADDGTLTEGAPLITGLTRNDSMCVDAGGNLYVGTGAGLRVFRPDGTEVTLLPIPGATATTGTTSCAFGGADGKTLYITSWTALYRVEGMPIPGADWQINQRRIDCGAGG